MRIPCDRPKYRPECLGAGEAVFGFTARGQATTQDPDNAQGQATTQDPDTIPFPNFWIESKC